MAKFVPSLFLVAILFTETLATIYARNHTKLILQLIHRDSIMSPFYNYPKLAVSEPPDDIRDDLIPKGLIFLVNISMGEPPIPQLLILDTGSPLVWVCTSCAEVSGSIYDPNRSSTFSKFPCISLYQCVDLYYEAYCRQDLRCAYQIEYADQTNSKGILASETFTFATSTGGVMEMENLVFGLGLDNSGNTLRGVNGIFGLEAAGANSLVARVANKFSYCIGNISDPEYVYNQLVLGEGAIIQGYSTPMQINYKGHYVVKLEGITIGEKQLQINQQDFDYNVLVDSGATLTRFRRSGFDPLKKEVNNLMEGLLEPIEVRGVGERPCYVGNLVRDLKGFPVVTLHLAGGADLDLDVEGMFVRVNDKVFCMAVDVGHGENIIAVLAQQYYNVGFDLNAKAISFQRIDCELLED